MIKIPPSTLRRADDPRLVELAAMLIGERLEAVRYAVPAGTGWEDDYVLDSVHDVGMGVELVTESGLVLELSWATPGREEGLSIALDSVERRVRSELIDLVDVGAHENWSNLLGCPVEVLAVSFHVHSDDSSVRPWSMRIGVSGHSVAVALGEIVDYGLSYMPDNLVVLFGETVARNYQIASSAQSAWGELIND